MIQAERDGAATMRRERQGKNFIKDMYLYNKSNISNVKEKEDDKRIVSSSPRAKPSPLDVR
jgi:hypothetical protein